MKIWSAALACGLIAGASALGTPAAHAQAASFPDVDANHWAYQAVQNLADKGYVKGYPDGKFLGKRAMTRYEFATVIDRIVQTVTDLSAKVNSPAPPATPTATPVTQDDLNKINALVDAFRTQLDAIQSQINGDPEKGTVGFQDQLDALRQDVLDTKEILAKTTDTANTSYGFGSSRKFAISGYVQARFVGGPRSRDRFPQGTNTASGAYNGNFAQGGNNEGFQVRRARLKFTGALTANTKYGIQIDTQGAVATGTANQQVTVREGFVAYTFGSGDAARYPTITAGLFPNNFGYQLPASSAVILTPERPLAFNENAGGLFAGGQDYDKGVQIGYNTTNQLVFVPAGLKLTAAFINGNGRASEETDRRVDQVYRAAYQTTDKQLGLGVSYYNGQVGAAGAGTDFGRKKQLFGADVQYVSNAGPFVLAEYVGGKYEQRTFFPAFTSLATTTAFAPGNKIEGYYAQGGYTFGPLGSHPLSLFVNYDRFRRASGGAGANDSYDDENTGYGASYNLDKQTRLRLYYIKPNKVAHAPTVAEPPKIGQTTAELQVRF